VIQVADIFSKRKRSYVMSRVKGKGNEETEVKLMQSFREGRITGWRRHLHIFGNPDFAFNKKRVAIFVDGCFWHSCPIHGTVPTTNRTFWCDKLERTRIRDRLVNRTLRSRGWRVIRIWQHDLKKPARALSRVQNVLAIRKKRNEK
jgi:DNA mismatch endonuclease (patch repair protein)